MQKSIARIAIADLCFVIFMLLSGTFAEWSDVFYALAFAVPTCMLLISSSDAPLSLGLSGKDALLTLSVAPILILGVFIISFLTSSFFSLFGISQTLELSGSTMTVILTHALLPALLEELLFRYAPLRLLNGAPRGNAVLVTSVFFALSHCNLLQLPYAIFAGIVFAALDIATGSILPSVILHFLNNLVSVWWMLRLEATAPIPFILALVLLAAASIALLATVMRGAAVRLFSPLSDIKSERLPIVAAVFIAISAAFSILTVFGGS